MCGNIYIRLRSEEDMTNIGPLLLVVTASQRYFFPNNNSHKINISDLFLLKILIFYLDSIRPSMKCVGLLLLIPPPQMVIFCYKIQFFPVLFKLCTLQYVFPCAKETSFATLLEDPLKDFQLDFSLFYSKPVDRLHFVEDFGVNFVFLDHFFLQKSLLGSSSSRSDF